jgi:hypothetical protein
MVCFNYSLGKPHNKDLLKLSNMQNEYVIINKTAIQKRIEELEKELKYLNGTDAYVNLGEIYTLKQILSQSTPLIPEIDKAYEAGKLDHELSLSFDYPKSRYISNLKLDI